MKKLSETLTELGIAFSFPIEIKDANGRVTYFEDCGGFCCDGFWERYERDVKGRPTYHEDSNDYWEKWERDDNGKVTYYEDSSDYWARYERDAKGNQTYFVNSNGVKRGTPKSSKTCEGKVIEVDGLKYKLTAL
jgi:hypothetical protein